jgi:hypothetical protein
MISVGGLAGAEHAAAAIGDVGGNLEVVEVVVGDQPVQVRVRVEEEPAGEPCLEEQTQ